uniref:Ig-like domain-containing protein n=1 Tax=Moschus moschiferus TaxID=68415 RepID=A0A8C6MJN8_MOSMO
MGDLSWGYARPPCAAGGAGRPRALWGSSLPGDQGTPVPTALYMVQGKSECHFSNGTRQVRFLDRYIYNREEQVRFDSLVGEYRARTEMGRPAAERWNRWPDVLQRARSAVRAFCATNYRFFASRTVQRRVEPTATVYPVKSRPLRHHNLLVCSVNGFYPGHIEVKWFRDSQEEEAGVVSTGLIPNGDWTFQIMVMLEIVPQGGEVYTCHVEHPSRTSPVTVEWSRLPHLIQSQAPHPSDVEDVWPSIRAGIFK